MKKFAVMLLAMGLFSAVPVFAAGDGDSKTDIKHTVSQCSIQADSIQTKIKKLETEIAAGSKKYDPKMVKQLKAKLDEANKLADQLSKP